MARTQICSNSAIPMTSLASREQERFGMPCRNALILSPKVPSLKLKFTGIYLRRRAYTLRASQRSECIEDYPWRDKSLQCVRKTTSKITVHVSFYFVTNYQLSRRRGAGLRICRIELGPLPGIYKFPVAERKHTNTNPRIVDPS